MDHCNFVLHSRVHQRLDQHRVANTPTEKFMASKPRNVLLLLCKNLNNFLTASAQLAATLLAHVIPLKSAELQKETPCLHFVTQRGSITFLMWCLFSAARNFPSWFETVILSHLVSGSFALQFNLTTVASLYPAFSSSYCWEFFSGIIWQSNT